MIVYCVDANNYNMAEYEWTKMSFLGKLIIFHPINNKMPFWPLLQIQVERSG